MLIAAWQCFTNGEFYRDLGPDYFTRRDPARTKARAVLHDGTGAVVEPGVDVGLSGLLDGDGVSQGFELSCTSPTEVVTSGGHLIFV